METGIPSQIFELVARGGWVMGVLALFSLVAVTIVLVKLQQFWREGIWRRSWQRDALQQIRNGDSDGALAVARANRGAVARVLTIALEEGMRDDLGPEALREEVQRAGDVEIGAMESHLRGLEVIGSLAPLLGLLGTVLGMIRAFMRLEEAGARVDPSLLSGGIWEALLTTAAGITVAIPAMAALAWLESQVDGVRRTLGDTITRALNIRKQEAPSADASSVPLRPAGSPRAL